MGIVTMIVAGFFLATVLVFRKSSARPARWTLVLALLGSWFLSSPFGAGLLMGPLQSRFLASHSSANSPGLIVVLSANASGPSFPGGQTELNGAAWRRLRRAVQLSRAASQGIPILYSGRPTRFAEGAPTESDVARANAIEWGVPPAQFLTEEQSGNTYESAVAVRSWLKERSIAGPIVLVTSAWHLKRAVLAFAKQGITVVPEPCDVRAVSGLSLSSLIPGDDALGDSSVAIREWAALAVYKLRGRL